MSGEKPEVAASGCGECGGDGWDFCPDCNGDAAAEDCSKCDGHGTVACTSCAEPDEACAVDEKTESDISKLLGDPDDLRVKSHSKDRILAVFSCGGRHFAALYRRGALYDYLCVGFYRGDSRDRARLGLLGCLTEEEALGGGGAT